MTYEYPGFDYHGDTFTITGTAFYDVDVEQCYDKDIGGVDGLDIRHFELLYIQMDGFKFTRDMLAEAVGNDEVCRIEQNCLEEKRNDILETV